MFEKTPVKTPVTIVNQPYLVGRQGGIVFLEAHTPFAESGSTVLKRLYAELKRIHVDSGYVLPPGDLRT